MSRVVVVGSGIAGLIAAIVASRAHSVTLVTKGELAESNTRYAQGGIAAAMFDDDSVDEHAADTLAAGAGISDPEAVRVLCAEGPARIRDLIDLGVEFDSTDGALARALEAAHSRARVLHAGGDATGAVIENALVARIRASGVDVRDHTFLADILMDRGRAAGVSVVGPDGTYYEIVADAVMLATGGAGQLFLHTTNPSVATGDGAAAALRAGVVLADTEFYQFHPTALAVPGNFLVSEAVRGAGAVLRDQAGHRFMREIDERAELAPRDVVARAIAGRMARQGGGPVFLDATALGATFLAARFPSIDRVCREFGFDWGREPIPVTPAAHYWMGGIRTDVHGRSSIPGLYAVGEVARTGVHGANRLASNSLLESLVFAWRAAEAIDSPWPVEALATGESTVGMQRATLGRPLSSRDELSGFAWTHLGLYRDGDGLREALQVLGDWTVSGDSIEARETRNLLELARVMAAAALSREESRGAHFRSDFPATSRRYASASAADLENIAC